MRCVHATQLCNLEQPTCQWMQLVLYRSKMQGRGLFPMYSGSSSKLQELATHTKLQRSAGGVKIAAAAYLIKCKLSLEVDEQPAVAEEVVEARLGFHEGMHGRVQQLHQLL